MPDTLPTKIALVEQELRNMAKDVNTKHIQNRSSIHELKNQIQECIDLITGIRIANARWNIIAGIITAIIVESIRAMASHIK